MTRGMLRMGRGMANLLTVGLGLLLAAGSAGAVTNTWTGLGTSSNASEAANWSGGVPGSGDTIVLDVTTNKNMTWDEGVNSLPATVAVWQQTEDYDGTVAISTLYGASGFTNFTVSGNASIEGGTWTHLQNSNAETYRLRVTVGGDLLISNATLNAYRLGYTSSAAPGYLNNHGGAYGGVAQRYDNDDTLGGSFNVQVYGSVTAPVNLGSPGYTTTSTGDGGGAILLTVAGTTTVSSAAEIAANGGGAPGGAGTGSGGSVYLTTGWLVGSGTICANGGNSTWDRGPHGSGGRVAVILDGAGSDFSSWTGSTAAYGGPATAGGWPGAAGTVYLKTTDGDDMLVIDNNNRGQYVGQEHTLMPAAPNAVDLNAFSNVVITGRGVLGVGADTTLDFGTFDPTTDGPANSAIVLYDDTGVTYPMDWTIDGYTLYPRTIATDALVNVTIGTNGVLSHAQNFNSEGHKVDLTINGDLTVLAGGKIDADELGYLLSGPGRLTSNYGGAHGGSATAYLDVGGDSLINTKTYGSVLAPTNLGSRGIAATGPGGGAVILNVQGTTTVTAPGAITANGGGPNQPGSGGSVYLRTGSLTGDGAISANGGSSSWNRGCGGGGGRVGIVLTGTDEDFSNWTGTTTVYGGNAVASGLPAGPGTLYLETAADTASGGTVIIDNATRAVNPTYAALPAFASSTEDLAGSSWAATNSSRIALVTNAAIHSLELNTGTVLELAGWTLNVQFMSVVGTNVEDGTYTPAEINLLTDAEGGGKVVVFEGAPQGTVISIQ